MKSFLSAVIFSFILLGTSLSAEAGTIYLKTDSRLDPQGNLLSQSIIKVYQTDDKFRVDGLSGTTSWGTGIYFFDLKNKTKYEILERVKVYMEKQFTPRDEAFIAEQQKVVAGDYLKANQTKTKIREEKLNDHPMAVYEIVTKTKVKKEVKVGRRLKTVEIEEVKKDYAWEALDYNNFPIRFEYPMPDGSKLVTEYMNVDAGVDIDLKLMTLPEGYREFGYY